MWADFVIQSEAKDLENILYIIEIFRTESSTTRLPPYGRLNDNMIDVFKFDTSPLKALSAPSLEGKIFYPIFQSLSPFRLLISSRKCEACSYSSLAMAF